MLNSEAVNIVVPNPPYPLCPCGGVLLPHVEPATGHATAMPYEKPAEIWIRGTLILFWKCSACGKRTC